MNVIEFNSFKTNDLVFCMVDNTHHIADSWAKELIKNQSDYTISNLWGKGYTVLQGLDENELLRHASKSYKYALVFSTGTEFLDDSFFIEIENQCHTDFLIQGHILDRGDAFYELHSQCYLINLTEYKSLDYPIIGNQELGSKHFQFTPIRSEENIHDNYTPRWISAGSVLKEYQHKCHGWNIITLALSKSKVLAFNDTIRNSKKHFYPEDTNSFYSHLHLMYYRDRFSVQEKVFKEHTESPAGNISKVRQVIAPASGEWYKDYLDTEQPCNVVIYDYNKESLKYWEQHSNRFPNTQYHFVHQDFLAQDLDFKKYVDSTLPTLINLSNVFCYVGTAMTTSTKYRSLKENQTVEYFKNLIPNSIINFSGRACSGFIENLNFCDSVENIKTFDIKDFKKPTWHINNDWL